MKIIQKCLLVVLSMAVMACGSRDESKDQGQPGSVHQANRNVEEMAKIETQLRAQNIFIEKRASDHRNVIEKMSRPALHENRELLKRLADLTHDTLSLVKENNMTWKGTGGNGSEFFRRVVKTSRDLIEMINKEIQIREGKRANPPQRSSRYDRDQRSRR